MKHQFHKTFLSPEKQILLLKSRGLNFINDQRALDYLSKIGYFRLSAYFFPLLKYPKTDHIFKEGASFETALDLYRFDKKLRLILFNELEKIEVAFRAILTNMVAQSANDIFWMTNAALFRNEKTYHTSFTTVEKEIAKSKEDFILHFSETYSDRFPPAWMIAEIIPLGTLVFIYSNLKDNRIKKLIANVFGLNHKVLESWLTLLYGLRNMCCHHSRTWNRELSIIGMSPKQTGFLWIDDSKIDKRRLYYRICIIRYLLFVVSPNNSLKSQLIDLMNRYPNVDKRAMGFPDNWADEIFWKE